jgi:hypothetical protein
MEACEEEYNFIQEELESTNQGMGKKEKRLNAGAWPFQPSLGIG